MSAIAYRISAQDAILEVNDAWTGFAEQNDTWDLAPSQVLGQLLWRFIGGLEVRHLYEILLARVRQTQEPVVFPFRCDSPAARRFMEMTMTPLPGGEVEFATRLVRTETRTALPPVVHGDAGELPLLPICSWCKKVRLAAAEWVEVEEAIQRLELFHPDGLPELTHGVCEDCYRTVMGALPTSPGRQS